MIWMILWVLVAWGYWSCCRVGVPLDSSDGAVAGAWLVSRGGITGPPGDVGKTEEET